MFSSSSHFEAVGRVGATHGAAAFSAAVLTLASVAAAPSAWGAEIPFKSLKMIIEYNSSAQDIGVQFFLDAEGWRTIKVLDPFGVQVFKATARGNVLEQGGATELFLESEEPPLSEVPLDVFFDRFREGIYDFSGRTADNDKLVGTAEFSHDIPAGPVIVSPAPGAVCAQNVAIPVVIDWDPVLLDIDGDPLPVVKYEVIVENATSHLSMHLAGDVTQLTVPAEFFETGTGYTFEVLAIEEGGNQTITEGCFTTAP